MRRRSLERFEELRGRAGATASADNASAGETPVVKDMFLGPEGIAVDDASIYFAEVGSSRIHTLSKPAGATDTHLAEGSPVRRLAIDDGYVYGVGYASPDVWRVAKIGGTKEHVGSSPGDVNVGRIAVDGSHVSWVMSAESNSSRRPVLTTVGA